MASRKTMLRISDLSAQAGVTPRTIRFYVQEGLLPEPERKQRNLALYSPDCVEKIKAIKKAQKERFLPLLVIRKILEQNRFDYSSLDDAEVSGFSENPRTSNPKPKKPKTGLSKMPREVLADLKKKKLVCSGEDEPGNSVMDSRDRRLISLLSALNDNGISWGEVISSLEGIQKLVEKIAEVECRALLSGVINNPAEDFHDLLKLEERTLHEFINRVRRNTLNSIVTRYRSDLDYAFLASADEGFAVQSNVIIPLIEKLEQTLKPRAKDKRKLNDLALAYSCLGNLEPSLRYLKRIRRFAADDPETQLRWIWYRRFMRRKQDQNRIKTELASLVEQHPDYAIGRAFMAVWHGFEIMESDDPYEILKLTNLCVRELEAADHSPTNDLHDWVMIRYITGQLYGRMHIAPGNLNSGIVAFESILNREDEINDYYASHKAFFRFWLWPNLYLFLGTIYNQAGRYDEALNVLIKGRSFKMLTPYGERLESEIEKAQIGK